MNEFLECHIEKVSSDGSKARGGNCDTRLEYIRGNFLNTLTLKATAVGSLPHKNPKEAIDLIFDEFKEIPFWPQLSGVDKHEEMTVQYIQGIPGIVYDEVNCKYYYDAQSDEFFEALEEFFMDYEAIINEKDFTNLDKYAITQPYTSAIPLYLEKFKQGGYNFAKCHIIGPFTWGTSLCDENNLCAFYDETYREVLIKGLTLKAVWQIQQIKKANPKAVTIMFMDEPVMSQFGTSAFITVKKEEVTAAIKDISEVIKDFGALSAVHCCGKSDWSVLIDAGVNIINFDAFAYSKSLGAYAGEMEKFLKNGGYIAWGIVPTLDKDALEKTGLEELCNKYENAVDDLVKRSKGKIDRELVIKQSFFTPSCGAGSLPMNLAQKAMKLVNDLSDAMKSKYGEN